MITIKHRENFGMLLNELGCEGAGIEIGVASAKFSRKWIPKCNLTEIYLVDAWKEWGPGEYKDGNNLEQQIQDQRYEDVKNLMAELHGDRVKVVRKLSNEAAKDFSDDYFDFVYIDANHSYGAVCEDLELWYPKVKTGAVFAGHDYRNIVGKKANRFGEVSICGVLTAVDEFCEKIGKEVIATEPRRRDPSSWYFIK